METSMRSRALIFGLAMTATTALDATAPLSIHVRPAMSVAPANLVMQARVEPDAKNRAIEIVADSEDFYRSSTIQLDGELAPKTTYFEFRSLPSGEYTVT